MNWENHISNAGDRAMQFLEDKRHIIRDLLIVLGALLVLAQVGKLL